MATYMYLPTQLLTVKSVSDLEAIGLVDGLDRETRDLYTMVVRGTRMTDTSFTSVSEKFVCTLVLQ